MERVTLKVGDWAWVFAAGHRGKLTKRRVVHAFPLNGVEHYVIEIETPIDPVYEVRDQFTVSDSKKRPIGMWRRAKAASPAFRSTLALEDQ